MNFENGGPTLLLDGKPTPFVEVGKAAPAPPRPVTVGDPHRDKPLKGDIGGLRIFDRALTQPEAESLALHEPARYILARTIPNAPRSNTSACVSTSSPTMPLPISGASMPN